MQPRWKAIRRQPCCSGPMVAANSTTSGCTREAIDFNAHMAAFDELGAAIIGVSPDDMAPFS